MNHELFLPRLAEALRRLVWALARSRDAEHLARADPRLARAWLQAQLELDSYQKLRAS